MNVTVVVGTEKGAFLLRSNGRRKRWDIEGPIFKGWKVTAAARTARGRTLLATSSYVYGPAIQVGDGFAGWRQVEQGPAYAEGSGRKLDQIWTITEFHGVLFAGVSEAGLFFSEDGAEHWQPVSGLNEHSTRSDWQPGNGGLCAHAVLFNPANPKQAWCGISAVGVFRTDDGGQTWHPKNRGVASVFPDETAADQPTEIGYCVHGLALDPDDPRTMYRQEHTGMFRTRDGGDSWERIERGLPSTFGFPVVIDSTSKALFAVPLEKDEYRFPPEGKLRVYRSSDRGDSWEALATGLPAQNWYAGVLRSALAVDSLDPCGVYMGTTAGNVHISVDGGDAWRTLPATLPRILCVAPFVEA